MDTDAPLAPKVMQDPILDTTTLPADHPPKFLAEARSFYKDSKPPFVNSSSGITEGFEREAFIAKDGQRLPLPIRAKLVAKYWDPLSYRGIYWTIDLNGERFIVQSFPNKGCVRGAKWIYCCWTGVGDNFEDLPLAFTCINGDYTYALGLKADSTAPAKGATTENDLPNTATAKVTPLPQDHPIEYLEEAEAHYVNSRPPFVVHHTRLPRRRVLLATEDGRFSATSTEAVVVYRAWDSQDDFPTLDLNEKRFIVMGNAGGRPGGYQYHLWLGSKVGRVKKVIAYSNPHADETKEQSGLTLSEIDEDSSSFLSSDNEEVQDSKVGTTETPKYCYENFISAFNPTTPLPQAPAKFQICQPVSAPEASAQKDCTRGISRPTKRARSSSPPAHSGSRNRKTTANSAKRTWRKSIESAELPNAPYDTPAPTPSTNDHPSQPSEMPNLPNQAPTSIPDLTPYKQTCTILRVTRDSNVIGFVPLRLRACMTMSALFSSAIAASGHGEQDEPIKCLMVVFDWKDEHDVFKTMYVARATEGSFEIFLEIINDAPCWKDEGGKCGIAVEIVRA